MERDRVVLGMVLLLMSVHAQYGLNSQMQKHVGDSTYDISVIASIGKKE